MRPETRHGMLLGGLIAACGAGIGLGMPEALDRRTTYWAAPVSAIVVGAMVSGLASRPSSRRPIAADAGEAFGDRLDEAARLAAVVERTVRESIDALGYAAETAGRQSEALIQGSALMATLNAQIDRVSQDADAASGANDQVHRRALGGQSSVREAIAGMNRLRSFVEANGRKVRRHSDRSVEIAAIVETIAGISQKTDVLALNATIESVRAGEHGRGFSLVAEEIRKLAERSSDAMREIGALAEVIQAETIESMRGLEDQQDEVAKQIRRVDDAGEALARIIEESARCAGLIDGIATGAADQSIAAAHLAELAEHSLAEARASIAETESAAKRIAILGRSAERLRIGLRGDLLDAEEVAHEPPPRSRSAVEPRFVPPRRPS